jgi:DNA polymerase-1
MDVLSFDIESASADDLHTYGPGFVRLCGFQWIDGDGRPQGPVEITEDPAELVALIETADAVTAHNGLMFDLLALAKWNGLDYEAACRKTFDTLVTERHLSPVAARGAQPPGYYKLGSTALRYGVDGKDTTDFEGKREVYRRVRGDKYADRMKPGKETEFGVLDLLKDAYGGYDRIPLDDPDYRRYLVKDVLAQSGVYAAQAALVRQLPREGDGSQAYLRREHYTGAAMGRVTLEGARVDEGLTMKRWSQGQARLEASMKMLAEKHGMPTEGKKPHTTNAGKAAFRRAVLSTGISERALDRNWPLNKDGSLSMAKPVLTSMVETFEGRNDAAAELCRTVMAMNGERTVYGTVLAHLVGGRVHPYIGPDQASGRWSMKDPGLTVLGKRGGKARERAMILADDGDVLVAIDADQIDARMIAAMSQDPEYMRLFAPGVDLHSEVALRVFDRSECRDEMARNGGRCDCEYRDRAKVFGHGWNYGMGWKTMVRQHGVAERVAQQFCSGMASAFPVLAEWQQATREAAGALGFDEAPPPGDEYRILYTAFGRPVRVERNRAYTQACAQIGQGSTRDGMAEAILKLSPFHRRRIRAVVHDEIVLSIPAGSDAQQRAQAVADSMAFDFKSVRISFGCSRVGDCWAACYSNDYCPHGEAA